MHILPRSFYQRDPLTVAPDLLGKILLHNLDGVILSGRIVETEAYLAFIDQASHSYNGKTARNSSLFGEAGHAYVHSIHKQNCIDIVTELVNIPSSILIRSLIPLKGIELMKTLRNKKDIKLLTNGPGKLCQALSISKDLDSIDVTKSSSELTILDDGFRINPAQIKRSKRVGLSKAKESKYRFFIA
ncbi:DNA-3-methyladenine glycosylase [Candidatus Dojkabacteria bacterium]|nr:DNA-3-methyladenine glycosylase [Candidatus Dojkabacteria bacterium]